MPTNAPPADALITWTNIRVQLGELRPWESNPRQSTKAQARRLLESFEQFGQVHTIAVGPDLSVYDGHQRLSALLTIHGASYAIDARRANRPLTEVERKKLVITLHSAAVGEWDWDSLSGWDGANLMEWGFDDSLLNTWKRDIASLGNLLESENPLDWDEAFDRLPDEDRAPFRQMTFTLHDTQAEQVMEAMQVAKGLGAFVDSLNENSNGNALSRICELFIGEHGQS